MTTHLHDKMLAAIDALFSASDAVEEEVAENLLLDVRDAINKHKLAAESLNEGLRLDDWPKIGCVNHDCDKCKARQEQPAQKEQCCYGGIAHDCHAGVGCRIAERLTATPQPPAQPLTDEQMAKAWSVADGEHNASASVKRRITRAIEAAHGITKGNT